MQSFGAYVVLLERDFGWSKTVLSGAFALTRVESGILGPLQGWLVDRFGPRIVLSVGTVMFGVGFMLFSRIETLLGFYLSFALIALGSSLGGFPTLMVSLVNWFNRHRAKAISISQLGHSLGGLSVPLVVVALGAWGWRDTAFASGVLVMLMGLPLVQLVRHRPEHHGEVVDGGVPEETGSVSAIAAVPDFTARQAMRTPAFWLISSGHALALLTVSSVMVHLVPHLSEGLGYTLGAAAGIVALMTGFQMFGQLLGGYFGDRVDKRFICAACMLAHGLALVLVANAGSLSMVVAFAVLHGLAWGIRGPQMVALRADYFGTSSFGTIMGFSSLIVMFGMSGGPIFAGFMADVFGNYELGYTVLAAFGILGAGCFLVARPPDHPDTH
ncbi:MAG: MFS transporter [Pseudomonadales bacterium]|jgi:MFS family permease|nr:MFS transporter [Pseudomonadales bacterium]MDP6471060.1 MFS transporter [Pseudomonadales bacterium]MDP6825754.1 MFS transporter [Pseudomonadales bacterium]MDP6970725.1 MFS transporter [Pseudomonadales bacterium]|tara:strand:- start:4039 stop:5193 length:1155 start_codon:yes stop_codon:yes gene_type:complete